MDKLRTSVQKLTLNDKYRSTTTHRKNIIKNCIITGSSGLIGSQLALTLIKNGWSVVGVDIKPAPELLKKYPIYDYAHIECDINKDMLDPMFTTLVKAKNVEILIHCAGLCNIFVSQRLKIEYYETNFIGTCNILQSMVNCNIAKIIYISSANIYDSKIFCTNVRNIADIEKYAVKETDPLETKSIYAETVLSSETVIEKYAEEHNFRAIIYRVGNVAGKVKEHFTDLISRTLTNMLCNNTIKLGVGYKTLDSSTYRDYIHIDDVIRALYIGINHLYYYEENLEKSFSVPAIDSEDKMTSIGSITSVASNGSITSDGSIASVASVASVSSVTSNGSITSVANITSDDKTTSMGSIASVSSDGSICLSFRDDIGLCSTPRIFNKSVIIYNLGTGKSYSSKEIIKKCRLLVNTYRKKQCIDFCVEVPPCFNDNPYICLNCTKIKGDWGFQPRNDIDKIIYDTFQSIILIKKFHKNHEENHP